jgi:hypothetical protein
VPPDPPTPGRYCLTCGYDLRANDGRCSECGRVFDPADPRTFRRRPQSAVFVWLRRLIVAALLLALPPGLGLLWLWRGWQEDNRHLLALWSMYDTQGALVTEKVGPLRPWIPELLPPRWRYLADRVGYIELRISSTHPDGAANRVALALAEIRGLSNLHRLDICDTDLTDADLAALDGGPPNLEAVEIDGASMSGPGLEHLSRLPSLKRLVLSRTRVTDDGLRHLAAMTKLESLLITQTPITGEGLRHLRGLTNLRLLELNTDPLTDAGLEQLPGLPRLETLNLTSSFLTGASLAHLGELPSLKSLSLAGSQITDEGLSHLPVLPKLESLNLDQTSITGRGLDHLADLPSLRTLYLWRTDIHDDDLIPLARSPHLTELHLAGTHITEGALKVLEGSQVREVSAWDLGLSPGALTRFKNRPVSPLPATRPED